MNHHMIDDALNETARRELVKRMWAKDHTLWNDDPKEIADRLGWLDVAEGMQGQTPTLEAFSEKVRGTGFTHIVLLGMGGSSLGPEVLRQSFQESAKGFPSLIVLDSTVPARIQEVTDRINPALTLFLVSSKSGTTVETISYYRYFRRLVEESVGAARAGDNFVAITDGGTPLEKLSEDEGFRRTFPNPPELGGRYSVLSYFGLVPAALAGIKLATLLDRAQEMAAKCSAGVPHGENPGVALGAAMAGLAKDGRDKLTLVASKSIQSFGLWAEQMIAESLGKDGKGIIPVAGEPLSEPESYGPDRRFVHLCAQWEDSQNPEAVALKRIEAAGFPVFRVKLGDPYDLGAEFFRWQFATAAAGALMGINPFDQPDVQGSKDNTDRVLDIHRRTGKLPAPPPEGAVAALLSHARPGDYLVIMAYIKQTDESDESFARLRRWTLKKHGLATTLGYGPRFLHSTGQLHKGGPANALFLQLTSDHPIDLEIPGQDYSFGILASAQSTGDLEALHALGRRAVRVHLGREPAAGLFRLLEGLD